MRYGGVKGGVDKQPSHEKPKDACSECVSHSLATHTPTNRGLTTFSAIPVIIITCYAHYRQGVCEIVLLTDRAYRFPKLPDCCLMATWFLVLTTSSSTVLGDLQRPGGMISKNPVRLAGPRSQSRFFLR